ncbi:hypothetical protein DENIS_1265 [Desulfonema ishimotonii]|uniref:DUF4382 domain-containing protein n=1 Tax=Desulfonema ishimotonii TaxID=45657 RepID=A0A401FTN9_9BACT|nr:MopE-related protein [Desulfonema ishimotonii]GBC60314.1 hypothetical protein DENIS_1265 [Desulfonema ishimotonii]
MEEGQFLDGPVEGLAYKTPTQAGLTDENGRFLYMEGETITFSLGGIVLGQGLAVPLMTPLDLTEGACDETHPEVINICRFLLTIDDDNEPDDGIFIAEAVRENAEDPGINFDLTVEAFEADPIIRQLVFSLTAFTQAGQRNLMPEDRVQAHMRQTLNGIDNDDDGFSEDQGDCDDTDPDIYPGADEICGDDIDQNCDGDAPSCGTPDPDPTPEPDPPVSTDDDGDGYAVSQGDCDDTDPDIYPGAAEICGDDIDQNCDGDAPSCGTPDPDPTPEPDPPVSTDDDGDGYAVSQGDCDDTDPDIYPGAAEICGDDIDQNCDGNTPACDDPDEQDDDGDGFSENEGDCDDSDIDIYPGATEICGDQIDQDCDKNDMPCDYPNDRDDDEDGYTENEGDCNDRDAAVYPGAEEICEDKIDQDCSGQDLSCKDADSDGDGYTGNEGDCDDTNRNVYPGAEEICGDGIDQDCDKKDPECPAETGTVSVYLKLSQATTEEYKALYVTVSTIEVHYQSEGEEDSGWKNVGSPNRTYNLFELINGGREELAIDELKRGLYNEIRLIIGETPSSGVNILSQAHPYANYIIDSAGDVHNLTISSGLQTGLKIVYSFRIYGNKTTEVEMAFDASGSVSNAGNSGQWFLNPTFNLYNRVLE